MSHLREGCHTGSRLSSHCNYFREMAPPPPPPPGPPLPPAMPALAAGPTGQQVDLLLQSIRQGTKLRKTVTNDKSGPFIAGKIQGSNSPNSESSRDAASINGPKQTSLNGGPPGLGNLFASGMPKLKPTGLSIASSINNRESSPRSLSTETKNRGPPPQPPPASQKPQIPSSASDSVLTSSYPSNNMTSRPNNCPLVLPSKAPTGGYGKPNVAPKPPVSKESPHLGYCQQSNTTDFTAQMNSQNDPSKPSPPPKKISLNSRPGVNRAQSMRVPKSPPVAPTASPPFPPNFKQSLVRNQSSLHQSHDSINGKPFMNSKTGTLPHNFQKMTLIPPNIPPPPAPGQRSVTRAPVSRPPPPPSRLAPPPAPPPPPPHRTSPAPPPPSSQGRLSSSACSGPPPPPVRNLSVRNGSVLQNDIENKFGHLFHNMQEFPAPGAFRNLIKNYNTRASAIAKQPAPPPPVPASTMQLSGKMWINNASHC